jgi:hypothetical protein
VADILEFVLEIVGDVLGLILDLTIGYVPGESCCPRIFSSRIFWTVVILVIAGIIGLELR